VSTDGRNDRLDTELLNGIPRLAAWPNPSTANMAAIPTIEEEDGKRRTGNAKAWSPSARGCQSMEGCLARLRDPRVQARCSERRASPRPCALEGSPLPPNALAEMGAIGPAAFCRSQIREIRDGPFGKIGTSAGRKSHRWCPLGSCDWDRRRDGGHALRESCSRNLRDRRAVARYAGLTGDRTRAVSEQGKGDSPELATPGAAAA